MRKIMLITVVLLFTLYLSGCKPPPSPVVTQLIPKAEVPADWQQVARGIEARSLSWSDNDESFSLTVVRIDPALCKFRIVQGKDSAEQPVSSAKKVCPLPGAAINAGYFDESRRPMGLLVIDGKKLQRAFPVHEWGTFQVRNGKPELVKSTRQLSAGVSQAIECKPRLVIAGEVPSFKAQTPAKRAAVGIDGNGKVVLAVTMNYLTLTEWANCLRKQLNCRDALNLDGGPSAQLAVQGAIDFSVSGGASVPVFICAEAKQQ